MQIGRFSIKNVKCNFQGITVQLSTVSVGAIAPTLTVPNHTVIPLALKGKRR